MHQIQHFHNKTYHSGRKRICFFLLFFVLLSSSLFCQIEQSVSREKILRYRDSTIRTYVSLSLPKQKISNSKYYYWINEEKIVRNEGGYLKNLLHGSYHVISTDNALLTQGQFKYGVMYGTWRFWNYDGTLRIEKNYKDGLLHGQVITYENNTQIVTHYRKGDVHNKGTFSIKKIWNKIFQKKPKDESPKDESPKKEKTEEKKTKD